MDHTAYLSNEGRYTIFSFGDERIKFIGPYSLERYEKIVEWDSGYIVVLAKYNHSEMPIEEYIDLRPILRDLYINPDVFCKPINKVEITYE